MSAETIKRQAAARALLTSVWLLGTWLCLALVAIPRAAAESSDTAKQASAIDLREERQMLTVVSTSWRFHPGNRPEWARPEFDDSGWKLIEVGKSWDPQGYREEGNQAWFRFKLKVAPGTGGLLLQMPSLRKNYQVFADGKLVGQFGGLPPDESSSTMPAARVFTLPVRAENVPRVMTLALRLWQSPQYAWISPDALSGPVLVGAPGVLLGQFERGKAWMLVQRRGVDYTTALIEIPIAAAALLLFRLTGQRFYLWFGLNMSIGALSVATHVAAPHYAWRFAWEVGALAFLDFASQATLSIFLAGLLEVRSLRLVMLVLCLQALGEVGPLLVAVLLPFVWADGSYLLLTSSSDLILLWLILRARRAGIVVAGLFLVPFALSVLLADFGNLGHFLADLQVNGIEQWIPSEIVVLHTPFPVTLLDLSTMLSLFGFLAVLVYRFARTSREEQRLSAALRAAHEIQSGLVPAERVIYGALETEVVYLAAEEVGGDFCQVLPMRDGSVLIAIGDVSGKGLQAAMMGTLLVGALRSLAEERTEPATVLAKMNEVVMRSDQQGFITCLCIAIQPSGAMTMANAGHLAPYVNGVELECRAGLPLGLVAGMKYEQESVLLPPQARLTLLSDGVVEARSHSGELFGFERTLRISGRRAPEIASEARRFGQQDDITVLTLDWRQANSAAV